MQFSSSGKRLCLSGMMSRSHTEKCRMVLEKILNVPIKKAEFPVTKKITDIAPDSGDGKSFFMGQLAYHVAMGLPLWNYPVRKGTVLYLALEDDYARLQRRLSVMFGVECAELSSDSNLRV